MKPYLVKTPRFVQRIFPERVWTFPNNNKNIYLTFDDGPIPDVTPWVLSLLKKHQAKATFFCIGDNIKKHPKVFQQLIEEGHSFGNHTFNHLNGWRTGTEEYISNCIAFEEVMNNLDINKSSSSNKKSLKQVQNDRSALSTQHSALFRPPYGKITSKQASILQNKGYKIIMWNVLSADFDKNISKEKCLENVLKNIQEGSIIVFHDSLKAEEKLKYVLLRVLEYLNKNNYNCKAIR